MLVEEDLVDAARHRERLETLGYEVVSDHAAKAKAGRDRHVPDPGELAIRTQRLATVGLIAASVAHDFNNAIAALRAHLFLVRDVGSPLPVNECMDIVDRCASLTRWLLSFSSPFDPVRRRPTSGAVDLRRCVSDALRIVQKLLPNDVVLVSNLGSEAALVQVESNLVVHVVINLILNARDALPEGGTIETNIVASRAGRHQLTVSDSGVGMAPETLQRAFDPFFTTKPPGSGTGLGLASVRGMVEAASGSVSIASELGVGTRVSVTFLDASVPLASELAPPA
jgi:two-component system, cell cycle sensor histidine kinase and response regulator CckA